ncbi:plant UBX domain-containing protein 8-like isoform X2 [Prosopis cineraria]|uniref:plant UBX domain-containing protein 8-like isoform X2 n=1 Tax=Prosopis cineraria TaxID=364024 RepID=UPI002410510B|nr:plant UBX domain-containing protein 8-like isoform X2 [Prosopis cineraria]
MARPNQEAIETFMNITGLSEAIAVQKLEEHDGDLSEAINAHFNEGDRNLATSSHGTSVAVPQDDFMDTDEHLYRQHESSLSHLSSAGNHNPSSLLGPTVGQSEFDALSDPSNQSQFVSPQAGLAPITEDVTGTVNAHGPDTHGTVITDAGGSARPCAPSDENLPDYSDDTEEQMIRAAIEASKQEVAEKYSDYKIGGQILPLVQDLSESGLQQRHSHLEDLELAHAISLSLKSAEQEKAQRLQGDVGEPIVGPPKSSEVELVKIAASNGRLQAGSSFFQDEAEDVEEQPLIRNRSRPVCLGSTDFAKNTDVIETSTLSSLGNHDNSKNPQHNRNAIHEEWGGMSSEEHDEAVMLEAAMFGGIPEGSSYGFPNEFVQNRVSNPFPAPRLPSPSLTAQRLIREQQDDEYLASLQADKEKELRAAEEAEAACEEERRKEEESHKKLQEEKELERQLAAKEAALPPEPSSDDEGAVTLLVRMPDGSRRGRQFLRSDNLQSLFDFIDIGRVVKPGTYRLVKPYPRHAFTDGESALTLSELGLTSKQEALFLELI